MPEEAWSPPEITAGKQPVRVIITKTMWRGGPQAVILEKKATVQELYDSLAGNPRLGFTCGYHWNFLFEYRDGSTQSIAINEHCEAFRRDPKRTWQIVSDAFKRARDHPSHFVAQLHADSQAGGSSTLRDAASRFGLVIPSSGPPSLLAATEPWSASRIERVNLALRPLGHVEPVREYDSRN